MGSEYIYIYILCLMNRYTLFDYLIFIYCTVYIYLAGRRVLCVYISHEHDVQNSISVYNKEDIRNEYTVVLNKV